MWVGAALHSVSPAALAVACWGWYVFTIDIAEALTYFHEVFHIHCVVLGSKAFSLLFMV
jgi:hypothetical protein